MLSASNNLAVDETNNEEYIAPKPAKHWTAWAEIVLKRIFFPIILLWDLTQFCMIKLLGAWVGQLVLPAQRCNFTEKYDENYYQTVDSCNFTYHREKFKVITHDGAELDTVQFTPSQYQEDYNHNFSTAIPRQSEQKYLVNFPGNGYCYEQILDDMSSDATRLKCNVIGFNLRGVGHSTGKPRSKDDLVTDGIAQVQRILDKGADPENIILKGHSLGAGVATLVAKYFHDQGKKIKIFNGRSFSTITNHIVGHLRKMGEAETLGKKILGWLAKPFVMFGLALVNWEIDAASAYKDIPYTHKEYMAAKGDAVIPRYASLARELKDCDMAGPKIERQKRKLIADNAIYNDIVHALSMRDLKCAWSDQKANIFFDNFFNQKPQPATNQAGKENYIPPRSIL